jgi:adenylate cyclase
VAQAEVPTLATLELDLLRRPDRGPLPIFGLLGDETIADDQTYQRLKATHEDMLTHYRARRWAEAQESLAQAREMAAGRLDALYDLYSGRIRAFRNAPPPDDWDGSTPGGDI